MLSTGRPGPAPAYLRMSSETSSEGSISTRGFFSLGMGSLDVSDPRSLPRQEAQLAGAPVDVDQRERVDDARGPAPEARLAHALEDAAAEPRADEGAGDQERIDPEREIEPVGRALHQRAEVQDLDGVSGRLRERLGRDHREAVELGAHEEHVEQRARDS